MRIPFEPDIVGAALVTPGQPWRGVEFHPAIGSTNERARELVAEHGADPGSAPDPLWRVVLTDHQTGGRGRLGRTWEVPPGAAVAVSAIVPAPDAPEAGWMPLAAGLALTRAVAQVTRAAGHELTPRLKWPNDVLLAEDDDRKVSGILCELVPWGGAVGGDDGRGGGHVVVVGAGVNVDQTRAELPVDTATSLALAGVEVRREHLVVAYLRELAGILTASDAVDAAGADRGVEGQVGGGTSRRTTSFDLERVVREGYEGVCSTIGATVRLHLPGGVVVQGRATGLDGSGALVVDTASGPRSFAAGDVVHVRRPDGRLA